MTFQLVTIAVLAMAIGIRSPRWWTRWMPLAALVGIVTMLSVRRYLTSEGLYGDPAPLMFWVWTALTGFAAATVALGWRGARWWRRGASILSVPLCLLCTALLLNIWVCYVRTIATAWNILTPLKNQADMATVNAMAHNGIVPHRGRVVTVTIATNASHFQHRGELVYLPPIWFTSVPPPRLPVVMMISGVFGTSADWLWAGNAQDTADAFAQAHGGSAPVMVFVDKGGAFNKDTECVNGTRGNAADHLTKEVVPYVISHFGTSANSADWGVAGWSMGGTCAIDLAVMHPELFSAFVDIAGDLGPNAGTRDQSIDRLFAGDRQAWASFDPTTVMNRHGIYTGLSGVFGVEVSNDSAESEARARAAQSLAQTATAHGISCAIVTTAGKHVWPSGAKVFEQTLPWLAGALHTPGTPPIPLPGEPVKPSTRP